MLDVVKLGSSLLHIRSTAKNHGYIVHDPFPVQYEELMSEWIRLYVFDESLDLVCRIHLVLVGVIEPNPTVHSEAPEAHAPRARIEEPLQHHRTDADEYDPVGECWVCERIMVVADHRRHAKVEENDTPCRQTD